MSSEVDFEHVAKVFEVLRHAHEHGLPYRNIFMAAKEELDGIDKNLGPKPISISVSPRPAEDDEPIDDE